MISIIYFICFYVIGCAFALMIYDVEYYEKYNGRVFIKFDRYDIINSILVLTSWFFVIKRIYKYIK